MNSNFLHQIARIAVGTAVTLGASLTPLIAVATPTTPTPSATSYQQEKTPFNESAESFIEEVTTNEVLWTQLQQARSNEERLAIAQSANYRFTAEEWQIVIDELNYLNQLSRAVTVTTVDYNFQPSSRVFPGLEQSTGPFDGIYKLSRVRD